MDHVFASVPLRCPSGNHNRPQSPAVERGPSGLSPAPHVSCRTTLTATATRRGMAMPRTRGSTAPHPWWCLRTARCTWPTWGTSASAPCAATNRPPVWRHWTVAVWVSAWTQHVNPAAHNPNPHTLCMAERVDMITLLMKAEGFQSKRDSITFAPFQLNEMHHCHVFLGVDANQQISKLVYHKGYGYCILSALNATYTSFDPLLTLVPWVRYNICTVYI